MFELSGMKFYGSPEDHSAIYAYPSDGMDDYLIPESYFILDEASYHSIRALQEEASKPSQDQILAYAMAERDRRLSMASLRIAPLQDAADLGRATETEKDLLLQWKQYRVDINRVSDQLGFPVTIEWPIAPGGF